MQFKGVSANGGKVTGKLCIVSDVNQFEHCTIEHVVLLNKVKPNAALVKKVKGVLAIHGGITSHAAIAARENNKPAIVGLPENMIENVKDGDMIEMNADTGIVEKLYEKTN